MAGPTGGLETRSSEELEVLQLLCWECWECEKCERVCKLQWGRGILGAVAPVGRETAVVFNVMGREVAVDRPAGNTPLPPILD